VLTGGPHEESDVGSCSDGTEKESLQRGVPVVEGLKVEPGTFGGVSECVDWGNREMEVLEGES
jgi:hypothetical protein